MIRVYLARAGEGADLSALARLLLERALGFMPQLAAGAHGKPYIPGRPDLQFSLSHTKGLAACAVSGQPVGVDVERLDRPLRQGLINRYFTAREQAYADTPERVLEVWTRKEAFLKRDGRGISVRLDGVETMGVPEIRSQAWEGFMLSVCGSDPGLSLCQVETPLSSVKKYGFS